MSKPIEIRGLARLIFILNNMPVYLIRALPDTLREFATLILQIAISKAELFARTGKLRDSLTMEMKDAVNIAGGTEFKAGIGPTIYYGPFVTYPTRAHWIGRNIQVASGIWRFISMHPGTPGNPYLEMSLMEASPMLPDILQAYVAQQWLELDKSSLGVRD